MNATQYDAISRPFRTQRKQKVLAGVNEALKWLCYVLYPLLLVIEALFAPVLLARCVVVPVVLFCAVSAFRYLYNAPRPYEALDIDPLIHKDTHGKSFPSRHIFSVFMIAMCWFKYCVPVGAALSVCGVVMAAIRVIGGVHYPKDVIAGALVAIAGGFVGLWVIPW